MAGVAHGFAIFVPANPEAGTIWAVPGVLRKKALGAMRAREGNA